MTEDQEPLVWGLGRYHIPECIYFIGECGSIMSSELRDTSAHNQYQNAISTMIMMGIAERRTCSLDLRYSFVNLTPKGERVLEKLQEIQAILTEADP